MDVLPVNSSRVKSAHLAERPLERGPTAPGAFQVKLTFEKPDGYAFDPSRIEVQNGVARVKHTVDSPTHWIRARSALETTSGIQFTALDRFTETAGPDSRGKIRYQLSINTAAWYYWDGTHWTPAGPSSELASSVADLNQGAATFHTEVGSGSLYIKALLISPTGSEPVSLKELSVSGVNTHRDGWE